MLDSRTNRRATIYDIAQASRTSPAAVSLVLNGKWGSHRISSGTAQRILAAADTLGYRANLQARALRLSRSGLIGMVLPHYRNRFFASLAETFEDEARERGLCPVVVSTLRDPAIEDSVVRTLLAQQVEALFVVGVKNPERLNLLCQQAAVPAVDIDLPGKNAPSVISDNRAGARILTEKLIACAEDAGGLTSDKFYFIGGDASDHATSERIAGFKAGMRAHRIGANRQQIVPTGFSPPDGARALRTLYAADGAPPAGVFVNSITALEGVAGAIRSLSDESFRSTTIACNDWDPFGSMLPLRILMARQNVERLIEESFLVLDRFRPRRYPRVLVMPEFPVSRPGNPTRSIELVAADQTRVVSGNEA